MSKIHTEGFPVNIPFTITITGILMNGSITGTTDGTTLDIVPTAGDYLRVGDAGTTSHTLNTNDDLLVTGKLEVNGFTYCDATLATVGITVATDHIYPATSIGLIHSATGSGIVPSHGAQTPDTSILATGNLGNSWIICEWLDAAFDFAHALQTNPTLFIHSAVQSTIQWISFAHDQNNGVIAVGTGDLDISGANKIKEPSQIGITAASDGAQGSGILTKSINNVSTVATACNCVTLPSPVTGVMVWVMNSGVNTLQVWPSTGVNLGAGTNVGKTLVAAKQALFMGISTTEWVPILGANLL